MKGKKLKQINNLVIYQDIDEKINYFGTIIENPNYNKCSVWSQDGRCLETRLTQEQAEEFCNKTKDFTSFKKPSAEKSKPSLDNVIQSCENARQQNDSVVDVSDVSQDKGER